MSMAALRLFKVRALDVFGLRGPRLELPCGLKGVNCSSVTECRVPTPSSALPVGRLGPIVLSLMGAAAAPDRRSSSSSSSAAASSSLGGWKRGDDHPNNSKPAWWADAPGGATIAFSLRLHARDPVIGVGFLSSWDPAMGRVAVTLVVGTGGDGGGDRANSSSAVVVLDGFDNSSRVSVLRYERICVESSAELNDTAPVARARPRVSSAGVRIPNCGRRGAAHAELSSNWDAGTRRSIAGTNRDCPVGSSPVSASKQSGDCVMQARLQFELLPRPGAQHNKFAIRYIVTC